MGPRQAGKTTPCGGSCHPRRRAGCDPSWCASTSCQAGVCHNKCKYGICGNGWCRRANQTSCCGQPSAPTDTSSDSGPLRPKLRRELPRQRLQQGRLREAPELPRRVGGRVASRRPADRAGGSRHPRPAADRAAADRATHAGERDNNHFYGGWHPEVGRPEGQVCRRMVPASRLGSAGGPDDQGCFGPAHVQVRRPSGVRSPRLRLPPAA